MSLDGFIKTGYEIFSDANDHKELMEDKWALVSGNDGLQEKIKKLKRCSIFAGQSLYQKACDDVLALLGDKS